MRITFDASVLEIPFTGVAKTSLLLYQECLRQVPCLTVTGAHRKPLAGEPPAGLQSVRCGRFFSSTWWRSHSLPRQIRLQKATSVHFPWNGSVPAGLEGYTVASTIHDVLPLEIPGYFKGDGDEARYRMERQRDIDRSQIIFTDSHYSKQQIEKNFRLACEPVVNYFGATFARSPQGAPRDLPADPYLLYLGGYDRRKGIVELLSVFLELRRQHKISCNLLLAGSAHYFSDQLRELIEQGKSLGVVRELGYVPDGALTGLLENALGLVYPSRYEGFGLPPLEAMQLGCPVLTTACTSIPEVCGSAALYADPTDSGEFAGAMLALASDGELRRRLSEAGLLQAAKFSWDKTAQTFLGELGRCSEAGGR